MSYLLLLALALVAGFVFVQLSLPADKRNPSQTFLLIALILLGAGLFSELVLGFALNETAAKLFFWARGSLVLAWTGQSLLLALFPRDKRIRWLSTGILATSLGLLVLVFLLHITPAVDWYSTTKPIYGQIGDLLATNRPARWGALAMNVFGLIALIVGSTNALFLRSHKSDPIPVIEALLIVFGAASLFVLLYFPPTVPDLYFYLCELFASVALFVGIREITFHHLNPIRRQKTQ